MDESQNPIFPRCSHQARIDEQIRAACIPRRYDKPDRDAVIQYIPEVQLQHNEYHEWLLGGSRVIVIYGDEGTNGTKIAVNLMLETIARNHDRLADQFRFRYMNAPITFEDMFTRRFDPNDNLRAVMLGTGMLILDDVDELDARFTQQLMVVIKARYNDAKVTVLTTTGNGFDKLCCTPGVQDYIIDGHAIAL